MVVKSERVFDCKVDERKRSRNQTFREREDDLRLKRKLYSKSRGGGVSVFSNTGRGGCEATEV
mgnify:CR=1 FL=1